MRHFLRDTLQIVFFIVWFIPATTELSFSQEALEQLNNIIPPSPEATALGRGADVPVSLYTGVPAVTVPIWTIKGHSVSVPISLTYQSNGMKVSEIPGWTGMGWSLHAGGSITRAVRGNADDMTHGYLNDGHMYLELLKKNTDALWKWQPPGSGMADRLDFLHRVAAGYIDLEPDIFYFNFNGYAGKFVLDPDGNPVMVSPADLKICFFYDPDGKIGRWEITDDYGVRYVFGGKGACEKSTHLTSNGNPGEWFYSTWYLSVIIPPNGEEEFRFKYSSRTVTYRYPIPLKKQGCNLPARDHLFKYSQTMIEEKHLSEISRSVTHAAPLRVEFSAETVDSFPGGSTLALKKIRIVHPESEKKDKIFVLDYSFFPATGCDTEKDYLYPCKRLRLDKIRETAGGISKPPYRFFYDPQPLPPRGSFSQDYWGYYNGKKNKTPVPALRVVNDPLLTGNDPPMREDGAVNFSWFTQANLNFKNLETRIWQLPGADLSPVSMTVRAGILKRIVYPTGGETFLEYEPNRAGYVMMPEKQIVSDHINLTGEPLDFKIPVLFDQIVTLTPLFYKKSQEDVIGDDCRVILVSDSVGFDAEAKDTIFSLSYGQVKDTPERYGAQYKIWLKKGNYKLRTLPGERGSLVDCIVYYHRSSRDKTYRVYSIDYDTVRIQAGFPHFPDDSSYRVIKTLELSEEDDRLMFIHYYFSSKNHPNVISQAGLSNPVTRVRITPVSGDGPVYENDYTEHDSLDWNQTTGYFREGDEMVVLKPGKYLVEFYPRIPEEYGFIRVRYKKAMATHDDVLAGGLRVRQKTDLDYARDTIGLTRYGYQTRFRDKTRSSGVLMRFPLYYDEPVRMYYLGQTLGFSSCIPLTVYSNSQTELGATSGSHIGYAEVTVSIPKNGKTITRYTSALDYPDISQPLFPFAPVVTFDWERGQVKEREKWSEEGSLRQKIVYDYHDPEDTVHRFTIPAVKVVRKDTSYSSIEYSVYGTQTGWHHPAGKTIFQYDREGRHDFIRREKYLYDPEYYRIRKTITYTSDSVPESVVDKYPTDQPYASAALDTMLARHMHGQKLQEEVWLDSVKISGERTYYGLFSDNRVVAPDSVQVLEGEIYRTVAWFDRYDDKGNLLQYHKKGDVYHALNYNDYGQVTARSDHAMYTGSPDNYPPEALVTQFSQDPLYGITSVIDPNGRITRYVYDPFGRLEGIRDHKNRILKKITYHYRTYQGDTSRPGFQQTQWIYSQQPSGIVASPESVVRGCPVTLSVEGGMLGTSASWQWFTGGCAVHSAGTGREITVFPQRVVTYYVRAEGRANITPCASLSLPVEEPIFHPDHEEVDFPAEGLSSPVRVLSGYTGCDPWTAQIAGEGFAIVEISDASVGIVAASNPYDTARTGLLVLKGNGVDYSVSLMQEGHVASQLHLTLSFQPSFVITGTEVQVFATVENGSSPYTYKWERKNASATEWVGVKSFRGTAPTDQITVTAGTDNFAMRCTVTSGGKEAIETILIVIAE